MAVVAVKNKFQVVIPLHIREQLPIAVGDILEATVEKGKITLTPKSLIDRHVAEGLEDLRKGRTHGPYSSAGDAIKALDSRSKRPQGKRKR